MKNEALWYSECFCPMTWLEARAKEAQFRKHGWRLPSRLELCNALNDATPTVVDGWKNGYFWSGETHANVNNAFKVLCWGANQHLVSKSESCLVRFIKAS